MPYDWKTREYKEWVEILERHRAGRASDTELAEAAAASEKATLAWHGEHYYA